MRMRVPARSFAGLLLSCVFVFVSAASPATKKPPAHPIDINSASSAQLQEVPGIGPATADKILAMRKSYGAFKSVDDLLSVRGIGPKRLEKMRKYLVAGHSANRRNAGGSGAASGLGSGAAKPAGCSNCTRAAPAKKVAAAPVKPAKPVASDGDAVEAEEEPE
jgi:competence ComEA-like helix-hairpin-helix protein